MTQARYDLPAPAARLADELLQADREFQQAAAIRADMLEGAPKAAAGDRVVEKRSAEFHRLADRITEQTDPIARIVLLAVVAYAAADRGSAGKMIALVDGDCVQRPAARVIQALLDFGGIQLKRLAAT